MRQLLSSGAAGDAARQYRASALPGGRDLCSRLVAFCKRKLFKCSVRLGAAEAAGEDEDEDEAAEASVEAADALVAAVVEEFLLKKSAAGDVRRMGAELAVGCGAWRCGRSGTTTRPVVVMASW